MAIHLLLPQAKVFGVSEKALMLSTALNESKRSRRASIPTQHDDVPQMKRQLADLLEKKKRIARCCVIRVA